jgi:frataxin-like iron-binding protein CyaY
MATRSELAARQLQSTQPFIQLANQLFDKLHAGIEPMKASNAGLEIVQEPGILRITTADGKVFSFSIDEPSRTLTFVTAKTGQQYTYKHDVTKAGTWVSVTDGHQLVELLARELVYFCKGYPEF